MHEKGLSVAFFIFIALVSGALAAYGWKTGTLPGKTKIIHRDGPGFGKLAFDLLILFYALIAIGAIAMTIKTLT